MGLGGIINMRQPSASRRGARGIGHVEELIDRLMLVASGADLRIDVSMESTSMMYFVEICESTPESWGQRIPLVTARLLYPSEIPTFISKQLNDYLSWK